MCANGLESYIDTEKIELITKDHPEYTEKAHKISGTINLYYPESVSSSNIKNDNKAKLIISRNLSKEDKRTINLEQELATSYMEHAREKLHEGNRRMENKKLNWRTYA
ncbi:hypothetical protein U3516DRAFT_862575 [Neocallimastix sp. 'constans']